MKDRLRKVQFKFLDYLFENMLSIKSKQYPDSTFFKKNDKVILELEKSGTLWVLYSVWSDISDTFSFEYEETQQLIKEWVEAQLKQGVVAPVISSAIGNISVEAQLKQGVVAPDCNFNTNIIRVQEEIKKEEVTPRNAIAPPFRWRKLNSVEVTPDIKGHSGSYWVESQLKSEEITPQRMNYVIIGGAGEEIKPNATLTSYHLKVVEEQLKKEEVTPRSAIPPQSWTNLKSEEIKPVKFYENELQVFEEQLKQEILKLSKDEKK